MKIWLQIFFVTEEVKVSCDTKWEFARFLRKAKRGKLAYSLEKGVLQRELRMSVEGVEKSEITSISRGRGYVIAKHCAIAKGCSKNMGSRNSRTFRKPLMGLLKTKTVKDAVRTSQYGSREVSAQEKVHLLFTVKCDVLGFLILQRINCHSLCLRIWQVMDANHTLTLQY